MLKRDNSNFRQAGSLSEPVENGVQIKHKNLLSPTATKPIHGPLTRSLPSNTLKNMQISISKDFDTNQ